MRPVHFRKNRLGDNRFSTPCPRVGKDLCTPSLAGLTLSQKRRSGLHHSLFPVIPSKGVAHVIKFPDLSLLFTPTPHNAVSDVHIFATCLVSPNLNDVRVKRANVEQYNLKPLGISLSPAFRSSAKANSVFNSGADFALTFVLQDAASRTAGWSVGKVTPNASPNTFSAYLAKGGIVCPLDRTFSNHFVIVIRHSFPDVGRGTSNPRPN